MKLPNWGIWDENLPEQARGTLSRLAFLTGLDALMVEVAFRLDPETVAGAADAAAPATVSGRRMTL